LPTRTVSGVVLIYKDNSKESGVVLTYKDNSKDSGIVLEYKDNSRLSVLPSKWSYSIVENIHSWYQKGGPLTPLFLFGLLIMEFLRGTNRQTDRIPQI
jgi:hypothetical protein